MTITPATSAPTYVAGIDCGGTNTDCCILEHQTRTVIATAKTPTTADPKDGILAVLQQTLKLAEMGSEQLASIVIGTTHFLNAVLAADSRRLRKVGLLRLGAPYTTECPPFCDFPSGLRSILEGPWKICKGGLQISGDPIGSIDPLEIRDQCRIFRQEGITTVVVCGVYSPIDIPGSSQEEEVARIVQEELPGMAIVCSREVGQVGFLEREAASLLNASILHFARTTIASFKAAIQNLGSSAQLFLTRNDGTLCSAEEAARLPVRTFSSGATNSLRGAMVLADLNRDDLANTQGQIIVADIGGTSTDVGVLLKSGFPRPAAAFIEIAGLRTNFAMPDIQSIGLGGGSVVRKDVNGKVTVGPDSIGYRLLTEALTFGGQTPTATDVAVAAGVALIGNPSETVAFFDKATLAAARSDIHGRLQGIFNRMKTSPEPATLILVGGGAIIAPDHFDGIGSVLKPQLAGCANAIGAATARVSGTVDTIVTVSPGEWPKTFEGLKAKAIEEAAKAGAKRGTIELVEADNFPVQYVTTGATRVIFKAVGEPDLEALTMASKRQCINSIAVKETEQLPPPVTLSSGGADIIGRSSATIDIKSYRPSILNKEWFLSELDLEWIAEGSGVLGVGGGGSTYYPMIMAREILRQGGRIRVKSISDMPKKKWIFRGGFMGSPSVSAERLQAGSELESAVKALRDHMGIREDEMGGCIAEEIGGGNGIQPLVFSSSAHLDLPVVDGDLQGRAYPNLYNCTLIAYDVPGSWAPAAIADAQGNTIVIPSSSDKFKVETMLRAVCTTLGSKAFETMGPQPASIMEEFAVLNTVSQCWWIGRSMAYCRKTNQVASIPKAIASLQASRTLFIGKITEIQREVRSAFTWGRLLLQPLSANEREDEGDEDTGKITFTGSLELEFQNEWLVARHNLEDGETVQLAAIVPDLITLLDSQSGSALGTHEVRFGLIVTVVALKGHPRWYSPQGLDCGGPKRFDIKEEVYVDSGLGEYRTPKSVIETFA